MKYAIVETGGKQYRADEGKTIEVDLMLGTDIGTQVILDKVLLVVDDDKVNVGTPAIKGAQIITTAVDHVKGPKVTIFKYQPKKRIRVKTGHRQYYTRLQIESIKAE